jgi:flagellin
MASFSVVNNIASLNAAANLSASSLGLNKALNRLSSGLRINNAADDAAGLAVANSYRNTVANINQGINNANDGLSTLQIQDGALSNISLLVDRLQTLATQSASPSSSVNRVVLNNEFVGILAEIDREATVANLNAAQGFSIFVSANATPANGFIGGTIARADTTGLALNGKTVDTAGNASTAVTAIVAAVGTLGSAQGSLGQLENRFQFAISLGQSQVTNDTAADSRIRDANIAVESANLTKFQILQQSGVAALAQANQSTGALLKLIG